MRKRAPTRTRKRTHGHNITITNCYAVYNPDFRPVGSRSRSRRVHCPQARAADKHTLDEYVRT